MKYVIKYGGSLQSISPTFAQDIAHIKSIGIDPYIIHGGGPEISTLCEKFGIQPQFIQGLRITDKETLAIVQMALAGKINKELTIHLQKAGLNAVGLSGQDGGLLTAEKQSSAGLDLGFVGQITAVDPALLHILVQAGYIPVIAPLALSLEGETYNINADSVAAAIATSLQATKLLYITDVAGIYADPQDPATKLSQIQQPQVETLLRRGKISGGMIPKIEAALAALKGGVAEVHIIDGRLPHALLHQDLGTKIYAS